MKYAKTYICGAAKRSWWAWLMGLFRRKRGHEIDMRARLRRMVDDDRRGRRRTTR